MGWPLLVQMNQQKTPKSWRTSSRSQTSPTSWPRPALSRLLAPWGRIFQIFSRPPKKLSQMQAVVKSLKTTGPKSCLLWLSKSVLCLYYNLNFGYYRGWGLEGAWLGQMDFGHQISPHCTTCYIALCLHTATWTLWSQRFAKTRPPSSSSKKCCHSGFTKTR